MGTERPTAGDLGEHPLPGLLFALHRENLTGTLSVEIDRHERRVYLRDGLVVAVISPSAIEACARILLDMGIVGQDHFAQSLMIAHETGRPQTEVLEEVCALSEEQLARARWQQSYETMMRLFRLRRAKFLVLPGEHEHGRRSDGAGIQPRRIISDGIRAAYDVERLREAMGPRFDDATFRINRDAVGNLGEYGFDEEARGIIEKLTHEDCTVEMLGNSELSARRVLYALLATDALDFIVGATAATPERKVAPPEPAAPVDVTEPGSYRLSRGTVPPVARRERLISKSSSSAPPTASPKPTGPPSAGGKSGGA